MAARPPDPDDAKSGEFDEELADLVLDESFVAAARLKEPAAAERRPTHAVAAPPRPRPARVPRARPRSGSLTALRRRLPSVVAVAVIGVMLVTATLGGGLFGTANTSQADRTDTETGSTRPAPASPFASVPAAAYAAGEAGLVLPAATAIDGMATAEVALALDSVRRAVTAASLDARVLLTSDLAPLLDTVGPATHAGLEAALAGTAGARDSLDFLTRFPSGRVRIAPAGIRVSGNTSYESEGPGVALVTTRHVFAYAVQEHDAGDTAPVEVVVVRRDTVWRVAKLADASLERPEVVTTTAAATGQCTDSERSFVRPAFLSGPSAPPPNAVPVVWDVSQPLDPSTSCFLPVATPASTRA